VKWLTPDTLSTWRKSCRWAACHFKNFETSSVAHWAPSVISSRGSSPGPKLAEAWSWPLTSISCWGYGSVQSVSTSQCPHGVQTALPTACSVTLDVYLYILDSHTTLSCGSWLLRHIKKKLDKSEFFFMYPNNFSSFESSADSQPSEL
jgi:hypothetical protein